MVASAAILAARFNCAADNSVLDSIFKPVAMNRALTSLWMAFSAALSIALSSVRSPYCSSIRRSVSPWIVTSRLSPLARSFTSVSGLWNPSNLAANSKPMPSGATMFSRLAGTWPFDNALTSSVFSLNLVSDSRRTPFSSMNSPFVRKLRARFSGIASTSSVTCAFTAARLVLASACNFLIALSLAFDSQRISRILRAFISSTARVDASLPRF